MGALRMNRLRGFKTTAVLATGCLALAGMAACSSQNSVSQSVDTAAPTQDPPQLSGRECT